MPRYKKIFNWIDNHLDSTGWRQAVAIFSALSVTLLICWFSGALLHFVAQAVTQTQFALHPLTETVIGVGLLSLIAFLDIDNE